MLPPQFFGVAVARVGTTLTPTEVEAAKCKMLFFQFGSWTMFGIIFVWIDWNQAVCQEIMMMVMIVDDGDAGMVVDDGRLDNHG